MMFYNENDVRKYLKSEISDIKDSNEMSHYDMQTPRNIIEIKVRNKYYNNWMIEKYKYDGTTDDNYFNRYDYVLDEMIWAFDFIIKEDTSISTDDVIEKWNRANNGLRLFGKYYASLWD